MVSQECDRNINIIIHHVLKQLVAIEIRHGNIRQDQIKFVLFDFHQGNNPIRGDFHLITSHFQIICYDFLIQNLIFNNQDPGFWLFGRFRGFFKF